MNDALLWNEFGNIYLKMDLYDEAISVYLKSIELNPDSGWTYSNLAFAYYKKGEFGRAISLYRISIPLLDNPKYMATTWNRLGDAFRALKDIDNAVLAYKKADEMEISPSLSTALANKPHTSPERIAPPFPPTAVKSSMSQERNKTPGYKPAMPDNTPGARNLPITANQGKDPQSLPRTRVVDTNRRPEIRPTPPEQASIAPRLFETKLVEPAGRLQARTGDRGQADTPFGTKKGNLFVIPAPGIDQNPTEDEPRRNPAVPGNPMMEPTREGGTPGLTGSVFQSTDPVQQVQSDRPMYNGHKVDSSVNLEETLAKVNIYENITKANPNNDRAWDTLGKLYKLLGRFEDSIQAYKQAIDKAPSREVYYYYLGLLYSVTKQDEEAAWAFENVLKLNPDYVLAHSALAGIYRRMGFESKANDHINIALPKMDNESAYNLACFYAICGEADKALNYLQHALQNKDTTVEWIKSDPDLDLLHNDPRYQKLILEMDNDQNHQPSSDNYFSSGIDGASNKLLPLLNNSLTR